MQAGTLPLIDIHYLPCVQYFSLLNSFPEVLLEQHEHFIKQTYRNRCTIYGANGRLDLIIPLQAGKSRIPLKDAEISYAVNWHQVHWKSIKAAYQSSPYFEYYEDKLEGIFKKKFRYLTELNLEHLHLLLDLLKIETKISLTESYVESYPENPGGKMITDLRDRIHPRQNFPETSNFSGLPYRQVFQEKYGFLENLSILDLLFNQGPKSRALLTLITP